MVYLSYFEFPERNQNYGIDLQRNCYDIFYPINVLSRRLIANLKFAPMTILYGSNGSGKTTVLNVIAEKLCLQRDTQYNRSHSFDEYIDKCKFELLQRLPEKSAIITSDDVFDYMLNLRAFNDGIDVSREEFFRDILDDKYANLKVDALDDYGKLKKVNKFWRNTMSEYINARLMDNSHEQSNGESAFSYFTDKIRNAALYLLDEPENSLSPIRQLELAKRIVSQVQSGGCQFIIATHSPFLLAIPDALVYNLDSDPVCPAKWTQLSAVRTYYEFFKTHRSEFEL